MDVLASYRVPLPILAVLQQPGPRSYQSGMSRSSGICWVLSDQLHIWSYTESSSPIRSLSIPPSIPSTSKAHVCVLSKANSSSITVLLCTQDGHIAIWLDASYLSEPMLARIPPASHGQHASITCFSASSSDLLSGPGYAAAAGSDDGSWFLVTGSSQGVSVKQLGCSSAVPHEPKGVLGALGSALSWGYKGYSEAFDPSVKFFKHTASGEPTISICSVQIDVNRVKVFVQSEASVDCWLLTVGLRPSEQLLWSFQNILAARQCQRLTGEMKNMTLDATVNHVCVWLKSEAKDGPGWVHHLQRFLVNVEGPPMQDYCCTVVAYAPEAPGGSGKYRLYCDPSRDTCLLFGPDASLAEFSGGASGRPCTRQLSCDSDTLAATSTQQHRWAVLDSTFGVMEVAQGMDGDVARPRGEGPLTADHEQQIFQLLDSVIHQAVSARQQQLPLPLSGLVAGLHRRLGGLGAFSPSTSMAVFAKYSTHIVDMLPKQWAASGSPAAASSTLRAGGSSFGVQLSEKELKHSAMMACLSEAGVTVALSAGVQRTLLENAEKLAVTSALLSLNTQVKASSTSHLLTALLERAGALSSSGSYDVLRPMEVFFARPSASSTNLLQAISEAAGEVDRQAGGGLSHPGDQGAQTLTRQVGELGEVLGCIVTAAQTRREGCQKMYHLAAAQLYARLEQPGWQCDAQARAAAAHLATACLAVRHLVRRGSDDSLVRLSRVTFGVVEVLLSGFTAAVSALTVQTRGQLVAEYQETRQRFVCVLVEDALQEGRAQSRAAPDGALPSDAMLWQVEELCGVHHCYEQVFNICEALAGLHPSAHGSRLFRHMTMATLELGVPACQTMAYYVFQRLYDESRHAELLLMPSEFNAPLRQFLQQHPDLLWLHLLRTAHFRDAATALVQDASGQAGGPASFARQRHLMCMAKLAARAAREADAEVKLETNLRLMHVQERMGLSDRPAMSTTALVDAALSAAEGTSDQRMLALAGGAGPLLAIEALAVCSEEERKANSSRWELAWKQVLSATNWPALDDALSGAIPTAPQTLDSTPLYRAAAMCCGCKVFGFGAMVTDSAPIEEVVGWLRAWTSSAPVRVQGLVMEAFEMAVSASGSEQVQQQPRHTLVCADAQLAAVPLAATAMVM